MIKGLTLRPVWPYVGEVTAALLGTLAVIAIALQIGPPGSAMAAGGAAAIVGATALKDTPHRRLRLAVIASVWMAAAVLLGWLSSPYSVVFVLVAGAWSMGAGLTWALGGNVGLVAATATALLVTSPDWGSWADAFVVAGLTLGAGLLQSVLVALAPRPQRQAQSAALAVGYRQVVSDARRLAKDPDAVLDHRPLIALRQRYTPTDKQARRRPMAFRGLYALPERIGMTLNVLRPAAGTRAGEQSLRAAANMLEAVAENPPGARDEATAALAALDSAIDGLPAQTVPNGRRLRRQVTEAATLHFHGSATPRRPPLAVLREQLNSDSPIFRHALRLAAAVTAGAAAARISGVHDGSWIALTVLLVLRPETAHTYTRCITRLGGVLVGVVLATAASLLVHPVGLAAGVLAVMFLGLTFAVSGIGYAPLSAAAAATIVFLLDIDGASASPSFGTRVVAVILGGGLAIATHVLLPDRLLVRLRQRAGELLKDEIDYAATVIRAFTHAADDHDAAVEAAWNRAARARSAFEAAGGGIRADNPEVRHWLTAYRAALNTITSVCATLESQTPNVEDADLDLRFVVAVDDYVDALRGEAPRAGQPWRVDARHLNEADQQVRECAAYLDRQDTAQRVLVGEIEAITRVLLNVAETGS